MDELTKLAVKHGTDKWGKHSYSPYYYDLFKDRKNSVSKVLEIGVAEGAGMRMFRDFFPNAMIYGAEIDPDRVISEDRIITYECDQYSNSDLLNLIDHTGTDIDLVVDDGSHIPDHQIYTATSLMSVLDPGVIYIIEDVASPRVAKALSDYKIEVKEFSKRYDDRIIKITHE